MFYFLRDSTKLGQAAAGSRTVGISMATRTYDQENDASTPNVARFDYFDSPSSTSQITYKVGLQVAQVNETFSLNRTVSNTDGEEYERGISCIIAQEIAG